MTESLTRNERRAARLDDPAFEYLRTPRWRRRLAATLILVLVAETAVFLAAPVLPMPVFLIAMAVLVIALVFALGALKASTRGIEELPPEALDERQAQVRGLVYSTSYTVLSVAFAVAVLLLLAIEQGWLTVHTGVVYIVPMLAVQLIVTIPTFVTALRMKV
ncbi:putative membrane protein [Conyzicola nivalis]|uniref:Membrane protein n=1 Tax=Conyzicola nivalis TaxID=1477021 RepID=A0ABV2QPR8_9MICO